MSMERLKTLIEQDAFSDEQLKAIQQMHRSGQLEANLDRIVKSVAPVKEEIPEEQPGLVGKMPKPETPGSEAPSLGEFAVGAGENILSGLTSAAAVPLSGIAGMTALATGAGWEGAKTAVEETQEGLTYEPRTESGKTTQAGLGQIASETIEPAMGAYEEKIVSPLAETAGKFLGPEAAGAVGAIGTAGPVALAERFGPRIGAKTKSHRGKKFKTPEEVKRTQFLESKGLTPEAETAPTRAQITQKELDIAQEERLAAEKGGGVAQHLAKQSKILSDNLKKVTRKNSHTLKEGDLPEPSGDSSQLIEITNNYVTENDRLINLAYEEAKKVSGGKPVVRPVNFMKKLREHKSADKALNHVISAMEGYAKDQGVFQRKKKGPTLYDASGKPIKTTGEGSFTPVTVDVAEGLVQRANGLKSTDPNVNRVLRQVKEAIDKDVAASGGTELFKKARQYTSQFYRSLEKSTSTRMAKKKNSIMQDILDDRSVGDDIIGNVLKNKYSARDISDFREFTLAQKGGKQAWQNLRTELVDDIIDNSVIQKNNVNVLSLKKLNTALDKFGKRPQAREKKMRQFFSDTEYKEIMDLKRALELIDRPVTAGTAPVRFKALVRWWDNKSRRVAQLAGIRQISDIMFNPEAQALTLPMDYKATRLAGGAAAEKTFEKEKTNE